MYSVPLTCLMHQKRFPTVISLFMVVQDYRHSLYRLMLLLLDKQPFCALVMDEMAIHRQVKWDGKAYGGFIDLGLMPMTTHCQLQRKLWCSWLFLLASDGVREWLSGNLLNSRNNQFKASHLSSSLWWTNVARFLYSLSRAAVCSWFLQGPV